MSAHKYSRLSALASTALSSPKYSKLPSATAAAAMIVAAVSTSVHRSFQFVVWAANAFRSY